MKKIDRLSFDKIIYNIERLDDYLRGKKIYPIHIDAGLVLGCNHDCLWCYAANKIYNNKFDFVDSEKFIATLRKMHALGAKSITLVGSGEPTLHPDFAKIVVELKHIGYEIGLFTNGSVLDKKMIDIIVDNLTFVRISFNGGNKETYEKVHKREHFDKVIDNIKTLLQKRKEKKQDFPTIGVQHGTNHLTIGSLIDAVKLFKQIGVDYLEVKPILFISQKPDGSRNDLNWSSAKSILEEAESFSDENFAVYPKYEQFMKVLGQEEYKKRNYDYCHGCFFSTSLEIDGSLYVCVNHKDDFLIGNVFDDDFEEMWWSKKHLDLIKSIAVNRCPKACRMDPLSRFIQEIKEPNKQIHPNFL
ncbi:MAG: radical SAM protein [Nanoarchaeota archaeon]|nr:radical SAM protein [Nanoarchaeota archaeon]